MTNLVEQVIAKKLELGCETREQALLAISSEAEFTGTFYGIADRFRVLVNDSAEEFAIQFMSTFNKEIEDIY